MKVDAGSTLLPWTCVSCTFENAQLAAWCDVCGGPAPLEVTRALDGPRDDAPDEYAVHLVAPTCYIPLAAWLGPDQQKGSVLSCGVASVPAREFFERACGFV